MRHLLSRAKRLPVVLPGALVALVAVLVVLAGPTVLALVAPGLASAVQEPCAAAEGTVRVGLVIDFGLLVNEQHAPATPIRSCVGVAPDDNGFDVLKAAGHRFTTDSSGLLCSIDGFPSGSECGDQTPSGYRYWSYFLGDASGWQYSQVGPHSFHVVGPTVQGWHFVQGDGTPPNGSSDPNVACPPAPVTTTAPPTTAPPRPTVTTTTAASGPAPTVAPGVPAAPGTPGTPGGSGGPLSTPAGAAATTGVPGVGAPPITSGASPTPGAAPTVAPAAGDADAVPAGDVAAGTSLVPAPGPSGSSPSASSDASAGTAVAGASGSNGASDGAAEQAGVQVDGTAAGTRSGGSPLGAIVVVAVVAALATAAGFRFRTRSVDT